MIAEGKKSFFDIKKTQKNLRRISLDCNILINLTIALLI